VRAPRSLAHARALLIPRVPAQQPRRFLDYEGAELMLIGAAESPEEELGLEFKSDRETLHAADVLRDLKLPPEAVREPLFEGEWK
jgi:hypothetical protein